MRRGLHELLTIAAILLLAAGCGGAASASPEPAKPAAEPRVSARIAPEGRTCRLGDYRRLGTKRSSYAAVVERGAWAYRRPGSGRLRRFGRLNINGVPTVFAIRGAVLDPRCRPRWYRVQLPMRPNGIVGYVRARDVSTAKIRTRIVVDVSARRLVLFRDGRRVLRSTVAVGSSATPTPTGIYYVNQRLIPSDPSGPFGPGAVGISAFSPVLTGWVQGGPIAIHGTNRPSLIGQAVSNGCIRLPNHVLRRVFSTAYSGTPVVIHP
jgi:hypothetical protein